jgi:hypothetical protein
LFNRGGGVGAGSNLTRVHLLSLTGLYPYS